MSKKESPLREHPLRIPGQSVQEEIDRILDGKVTSYLLMILGFVGLALLEWLRYVLTMPPSPWALTVAAVLVTLWCVPRLVRTKRKLRELRQGRDGELIVAEVLDKVRGQGAIVFHDVCGPGFNVDHVILCRHGIFAVETKTYSKRKGAQVTFNGKDLLIDGRTPSADPVVQARSIASWVAKTLRESTGKAYSVKPVLVFPGWFVNPIREQGGSDVWVMNPDALPKFIPNERLSISEEDFRLAAFHIARIARSGV